MQDQRIHAPRWRAPSHELVLVTADRAQRHRPLPAVRRARLPAISELRDRP